MTEVVDCIRGALISTEGPEVDNLTSFPKDRTRFRPPGQWIRPTILRLPNYLAKYIDCGWITAEVLTSRERPQGGHDTVLPDETYVYEAIKKAHIRSVGIR
ncbi:MAG: hypothetical protein WA657_26430, partial [Candidatus Acidiferrales bacterium]